MTQNTDPTLEQKIIELAESMVTQMEKDLLPHPGLLIFKPGHQISGSTQITDRAQSRELQPLNTNELKSVYALLAYVAHNENVRQDFVQSIVEANFNVNDVTRIQQKDYDDVIRFLVDLRIDELGD